MIAITLLKSNLIGPGFPSSRERAVIPAGAIRRGPPWLPRDIRNGNGDGLEKARVLLYDHDHNKALNDKDTLKTLADRLLHNINELRRIEVQLIVSLRSLHILADDLLILVYRMMIARSSLSAMVLVAWS